MVKIEKFIRLARRNTFKRNVWLRFYLVGVFPPDAFVWTSRKAERWETFLSTVQHERGLDVDLKQSSESTAEACKYGHPPPRCAQYGLQESDQSTRLDVRTKWSQTCPGFANLAPPPEASLGLPEVWSCLFGPLKHEDSTFPWSKQRFSGYEVMLPTMSHFWMVGSLLCQAAEALNLEMRCNGDVNLRKNWPTCNPLCDVFQDKRWAAQPCVHFWVYLRMLIQLCVAFTLCSFKCPSWPLTWDTSSWFYQVASSKQTWTGGSANNCFDMARKMQRQCFDLYNRLEKVDVRRELARFCLDPQP